MKNIRKIIDKYNEQMLYLMQEVRYVSTQKEENFKRLAENRTNKIIDMIRLLGNLSNTSNYTYTDEQVNAIFDTLEEELKNQRSRFSSNQNKKRKFRL